MLTKVLKALKAVILTILFELHCKFKIIFNLNVAFKKIKLKVTIGQLLGD